ncbi:MAG: TRAP transporter small permease [Brevibacillus sp.]|nr:TRAP transporter small permease [Brevibacillus sp.]
MDKVNKFLNHVEEHLGVYLMLITSFLVFIQVVLRYLFHYSLFWSEEVARYLIIWLIFIGSSIAVREKAHAVVDVVIAYLPPVWQRIFAVLGSAAAILFCGFLFIAGWEMIGHVIDSQVVTPSLGIPMVIPYLAIPVGAALMLLRFGQDVRRDFIRLWNGSKEETKQ